MNSRSGEANNGIIEGYRGSNSQSEYNPVDPMFMQPFPPANFAAPYFHPTTSVSRPSTPTSDSSTSLQEGQKCTRKRVGWGDAETRVLIDVWAPLRQEKKKCGPISTKNFQINARRDPSHAPWKTPDQIKKRVKNLEYEYRQVRTRMLTTGEKGANKIKKSSVYFDDLDAFLGTREGLNPGLMTIQGTNLTAVERQASETQLQDSCGALDDEAEKEREARGNGDYLRAVKGNFPKSANQLVIRVKRTLI